MLDGDNCNYNNTCLDNNITNAKYVFDTYFNNPNNTLSDTLVANYRNILFQNNCDNSYHHTLYNYIG